MVDLLDALAVVGGHGGFEYRRSAALIGELGGAQIAQLVDQVWTVALSMVFEPDIHLSPVLA